MNIASAANGYVGAVVMVEGGFRVRMFYTDDRFEDHVGPLIPTAEKAARAMADLLASLAPASNN